jgi:hypothetical protein
MMQHSRRALDDQLMIAPGPVFFACFSLNSPRRERLMHHHWTKRPICF